MLKLLLITAVFIGAAIILLALKLLLKGDSRGPVTHVGASKHMRQRGIHCVESMDSIERFQLQHKLHAEERVKK